MSDEGIYCHYYHAYFMPCVAVTYKYIYIYIMSGTAVSNALSCGKDGKCRPVQPIIIVC